jgi:DNA polymerase III subunit epsilon
VSLGQRLRLAIARRRCRLPLQAGLLELPLPSPRARLADLELVALDFETTGLDPSRDHVIAAGWVLLRGDRIVLASAREVRARNEHPGGVGQSAVIHGIVDSDLDAAEDIEALLGHLLPDLGGRAVVAHAAPIERRFLAATLRRLGGVALPNPFIDTMRIERRLLDAEGIRPDEYAGALSLDACRARRGLPEHQRHAAGSDALACAELLLAQVARLGGARRVRLRELL